MKNKLAGLLVIYIIMMFLFAGTASADAGQFAFTVSPASLSGAGTVTITFTIKNTSGSVSMAGVQLSGPNANSTIGDIAPGDTKTASLNNYQVSDAQLSNPIVFTFSWTEDGISKQQNVNVTVQRDAGAPELKATRTTDKQKVPAGGKVNLTYTIDNTGTAVLTDITIIDANLSSKPILSVLTLNPGENKTVTYTYTMGSKDVTSAPVVNYKFGGSAQKVDIAPVNIELSTPALAVDVTAAAATTTGTAFKLVLRNTGSEDIFSIKVTDELGKSVNASPFDLAVGAKVELSYNVLTDMVRKVVFSVNGTSAGGQPYAYQTKIFEVRPFVDPNSVKLELVARIATPVDDKGSVKISFTVKNSGAIDIKEITISEQVLGQITKIPSLSVGASKQADQSLNVGKATVLNFTAQGKDEQGNVYTASTTLQVQTDTSATPGAQITPSTTMGSTGNALLTVLIVLGVLVVLAAAVLIILSRLEKRHREEATLEEERKTRVLAGKTSTGQQLRPRPNPTLEPPLPTRGDLLNARSRQPIQKTSEKRPQQPSIPSKKRFEDIDDYAVYDDDYSAEYTLEERKNLLNKGKKKTDETLDELMDDE